MKRKLVSLFLVVLLVLSISPALADTPEVLSLSIKNWVKAANWEETPVHKAWMAKMEEYLGCKLDITWNPVDYVNRTEAMNLYMAAGNFDDVFISQATQEVDQQLGDAGLLVNIMDYEDQLVYYKEWLADNHNLEKLQTADGAIYGFSMGEIGEHYGNQQVFIYREDIFKKHNLTIPSTQEEFYQVAKTLKELYPESYPVGGGLANGTGYNFYTVWLMMNKTYYSMYFNGEKFVYAPVYDAEAFKETLTYLNKMWSEGLIDPEVMTQSDEQGFERMLNGRNFIVPDHWTGETARLKDDNIKWCFAPRPTSYKGEIGWKPGSLCPTYKLNLNDMMVISTKAKNIETIVKLLDYQYCREVVDLVNWGIEGLTYNVVDGKKVFIDEIRNAPSPRVAGEPYGILACATQFPGIRASKERGAWSGIFPGINVYANGEYFVYDDIWKFTNDYEHGQESVFPNEVAPPVQLTEDESNLKTEVITPLDTYVHESIMQFITGAKSLDEFEAWQDSLQYVGDYKTLVDLYNSKIGVAE